LRKIFGAGRNNEKYRNLESLEFQTLTGETPYFFRFLPFLRNPNTVEVTGSNPRSPTIPSCLNKN
jgi:hypothetical protein